jgi:hypothetical protein
MEKKGDTMTDVRVRREVDVPVINSVIYNANGVATIASGASSTRRRLDRILISPTAKYYYTGSWKNANIPAIQYLNADNAVIGFELKGTGTEVAYDAHELTIPSGAVVLCVNSENDVLMIEVEDYQSQFAHMTAFNKTTAKKRSQVILTYDSPGYIMTDGTLRSSTGASAKITPLMEVDRNATYYLTTTIDQYRIAVAFYDEGENYIGSFFRRTDRGEVSGRIDFPFNAKYYRLCGIDSIELIREEAVEALEKNFGAANSGKVLRIGEDGNAVPVTYGGGEGDAGGDAVRQKSVKTLHLGANVLNGIVASGSGWTHSNGVYTHASGATTTLEFPYDTEEGSRYVAVLNIGNPTLSEQWMLVSIGDGEKCDIYNGTTGPMYVGIISDGGRLKIEANSSYASTVYGVELRKVVEEAAANITIELNLLNVDSSSMTDNLTGFWNIAVAPNNAALARNQHGSRNVAIGIHALENMEGGERNIALGTFVMNQLRYGVRNIAIGADALYRVAYANDNVAIGKASMGQTFADILKSTFVENVALGTHSLGGNYKTCARCVAVGHHAGAGSTGLNADKLDCVAVGYESGYYESARGVSIGSRAGRYAKGTDNVHIGANAGDSTTTGSQCTIIGSQAKAKDGNGTWQNPTTLNNAIAIGYNATAKKSNQVVIGNQYNTEFILGNRRIIFNEDGTCTWEFVA